MNAAWTTAFVVLSILVFVLGVLVIGLLRRLAPVLDRLEASSVTDSSPVREGLDAGMRIGRFEAVTASGQTVDREAITRFARQSVIVFVEPGCGHCENIMSELVATPWRSELLPLYLVLSESPEARQYQLERSGGAVLYQHDNAVSDAFGTNVSPVAFVLDADGTVVSRHIPRQTEDLVAIARPASRDPQPLPVAAFHGH